MDLNSNIVNDLKKEFGEAFYLLDTQKFKLNYMDLKGSFSAIYPNFNIAYSYKTNYIPKLCKIVNEMGGYAEVVSEMELELARRVGVPSERIIWNGPIKDLIQVEKLLLDGGCVNVDSMSEMIYICDLAEKYNDRKLNIGLRCNFDIGDGVISRFGFDIDDDNFREALKKISLHDNITLLSLQCHFAKRQIDYWKNRATGMLKIIKDFGLLPKRIDLGGGLYGFMPESLRNQFSVKIPSYEEYAITTAKVIADYYDNAKEKPELIIEPGSALVGDCMDFVCIVKTIKQVRGKYFASVLGSQKNISMTGVNPPIKLLPTGNNQNSYNDIDFVGYTCIEGDVLYRNYNGNVSVGDTLVIGNCGSYSVVMKPPFILPNFPILDISGGGVDVIKNAESFEDIFRTYNY